MTTPYPTSFYVAHMLFKGHHFGPDGVWGDVLDGPVTSFDEVVDIVGEFNGNATLGNLRVWHFVGYGEVEDCTNNVISAVCEKTEEMQ